MYRTSLHLLLPCNLSLNAGELPCLYSANGIAKFEQSMIKHVAPQHFRLIINLLLLAFNEWSQQVRTYRGFLLLVQTSTDRSALDADWQGQDHCPWDFDQHAGCGCGRAQRTTWSSHSFPRFHVLQAAGCTPRDHKNLSTCMVVWLSQLFS